MIIKNNKVKIGVAIMVHNMAVFVGATVRSLSWTDGIYIFDDNSNDGSAEIAKKISRVPIFVEKSKKSKLAFERGELKVRNYVIDQAFSKIGCDVLVLLDADELLSENLRPVIEKKWSKKKFDSIAFTTWHLFDQKRYLHFWETHINGVYMIDPHTRVITKGKYFEKLFSDGSHPIINATPKTFCTHEPYHFHLKYFKDSPFPNYALNFLPKRITLKVVKPYLRNLPFALPNDIKEALDLVDWRQAKKIETSYYNSYKYKRVQYSNPKLAFMHPKDKE